MFPHNECEIAQIEAATGTAFCNYWLLNNMVTVDGTKMSKSLGNFTTIKDALSRHNPMTIRFFILSSHYRSPTDFSEGALEAAGRGFERLSNTADLVAQRMRDAESGELHPDWAAKVDAYRTRFEEAMNDDYNTPRAIAVLFDLSREVNAFLNSGQPESQGTLAAIGNLYQVLGGDVLGLLFGEQTRQGGSVPDDGDLLDGLVRMLIDIRQEARQARNWAQADAIRDRLAALGVTLEDGPEGTRWRQSR